jgi:nucleosome binding factor SPN SPT16 subunit
LFSIQRFAIVNARVYILTNVFSPPAKILSQVENAVKSVTIEILARPKGKDASNDALSKFLAQYTSAKRVGTLVKEAPSGKLVSEWQAAVDKSVSKPEFVDMAPAISSLMAIKDEEELVSICASLDESFINRTF